MSINTKTELATISANAIRVAKIQSPMLRNSWFDTIQNNRTIDGVLLSDDGELHVIVIFANDKGIYREWYQVDCNDLTRTSDDLLEQYDLDKIEEKRLLDITSSNQIKLNRIRKRLNKRTATAQY